MSVRITVDGETVQGVDGQTIAGVLLGAGRRTWRTAAGAERGIFCGIGICQDCVLTVNGVEGVRACQRPAVDGDVIVCEVRA
ncbi:(2Fe-2S)-binding protein [Microbacterium capsulatum]|uniref:(2Fe-2S)-binding protein n=1 Tax=Microbacterium capsulatum TaxID=3041921 RepID=A0ABU0XHR4_9MICO|nr:(2Fe-2S)-binding protein [Microbacterium sp. ASV81]MDQ4213245.1 (2Fe-2S)-binding protein [Microbacterium sp. ASV81]